MIAESSFSFCESCELAMFGEIDLQNLLSFMDKKSERRRTKWMEKRLIPALDSSSAAP